MLPFLIVGAIGLLLLLSSIVIGDLLDLVGIGDGLVSGVAVGAALSIFGVAGIITVSNGLATWLTYVIAVALALVALVAIQLFVSHIAKQESGGRYSPVGLVGFTTVSTGPAGGEVRLDDVRELERRPAISDAAIAAQTRIRVVEEDGFRVLSSSEKCYDLIINDAFTGREADGNLSTDNALQLIRSRLRPGGLYLINIPTALAARRSRYGKMSTGIVSGAPLAGTITANATVPKRS
jgi:hypothetical protein